MVCIISNYYELLLGFYIMKTAWIVKIYSGKQAAGINVYFLHDLLLLDKVLFS